MYSIFDNVLTNVCVLYTFVQNPCSWALKIFRYKKRWKDFPKSRSLCSITSKSTCCAALRQQWSKLAGCWSLSSMLTTCINLALAEQNGALKPWRHILPAHTDQFVAVGTFSQSHGVHFMACQHTPPPCVWPRSTWLSHVSPKTRNQNYFQVELLD